MPASASVRRIESASAASPATAIVTSPSLMGPSPRPDARPRAAAPALRAPAAGARWYRSRAARPWPANIARASSLIMRGVARAPRCVSASSFTSLAAASSAASAAVEWRVSRARATILRGEARLVHEQIGAQRRAAHRRARPRVAAEDERAAAARRPEHRAGRDDRAVARVVTEPPRCSSPNAGPSGTPSRRASSTSNWPGRSSSLSSQRHGGAAVVDGVRDQPVAVAGHLVAVAELAHVQREAEPPDDRREDREQVAEPGRPVELEALLAPAQVIGLEQARAARARDRRGSG